MNTNAVRLLTSKLIWWITGALVGCYVLFSFDYKRFSAPEGSFIERLYDAVKLPGIKLGIDLQGGTYLVLGVGIDKAIEQRLLIESRSIEKMLKRERAAAPTKKDVKGKDINLLFGSDASAREAYALIKERVGNVKATLTAATINLQLSSAEASRIRSTAVEQAVNVLRTRLDAFDVRGLLVQQHGDDQVVVQLPGLGDAEDVKESIMRAAQLEFKIVERVAGSRESLLDAYDGDLPSDKMIVPSQKSSGEGQQWYLVSVFPDVTGDHVADAHLAYDEYQRAVVAFKLDSEGAQDFREVTGRNIGRQLGIIMDNMMICAPSINTEIGGSGQITGRFTPEEAGRLAMLIKSGALLAPLSFLQENRVGASLGQDSINKGLVACMVALALLFFFGILYYRLAGIFAIFALMYNLLLTLLFLSYFKATLTLPGIAGMVLTIGMAIDASILIYEKMREELAGGATLRKAVSDGFGGAMGVILDSNITTFLTGLVLFQFGGPAIRGFAVTIMIGIVATIISGVYFLRAIFDFLIDFAGLKRLHI